MLTLFLPANACLPVSSNHPLSSYPSFNAQLKCRFLHEAFPAPQLQCLSFSGSTRRICLEGLWFSAVRARPSSGGPHSQKDSWASGIRGRNQKASLSLRSGILSFFQIKRSSIRKGMVMVSPRLNPQASWEFEAEILVLHHPTTISPRYQAMGRCRRALPAQGPPTLELPRSAPAALTLQIRLQPKGRPPSCLAMSSVPPASCRVCSVP